MYRELNGERIDLRVSTSSTEYTCNQCTGSDAVMEGEFGKINLKKRGGNFSKRKGL